MFHRECVPDTPVCTLQWCGLIMTTGICTACDRPGKKSRISSVAAGEEVADDSEEETTKPSGYDAFMSTLLAKKSAASSSLRSMLAQMEREALGEVSDDEDAGSSDASGEEVTLTEEEALRYMEENEGGAVEDGYDSGGNVAVEGSDLQEAAVRVLHVSLLMYTEIHSSLFYVRRMMRIRRWRMMTTKKMKGLVIPTAVSLI